LNSHQRRVARRLVLRKLQQQAMSIRKSWQSTGILIPMIRKLMPTMIAHQIVGVQPMTGPTGSIFGTRRPKFERLDFDVYGDAIPVPEGYCVVDVDLEIHDWIREQPIHLWKDSNRVHFLRDRFVIADDLYTALALRWM
jgi:hypothetical protein